MSVVRRRNRPLQELQNGGGTVARSSARAEPEVRDRIVSAFFVTVDIESYYDEVRSDALDYFEQLVEYCIAYEKSNTNRLDGHLHMYLKFEEGYKLGDFNEIIREYFVDCRVDIQKCKSRRSCLKYISKEDYNLLSNIKKSDMHMNYRIYHWAKDADKFCLFDPFVIEHRNQYKFLERMYHEVKFSIADNLVYRPLTVTYVGWPLEVASWWNGINSGYVHKAKQLYLFGSTNVGKSTYIESLLGRKLFSRVFYPGVGKFFLQGLNVDYHSVILFEEFEYKYHHVSMLKRLLEGKPYAYPVKCERDQIIQWRKPIIFVSNFDEVSDPALRQRLKFVRAEEPFWQLENNAVVPKVEKVVDDVIEISSEDETNVRQCIRI